MNSSTSARTSCAVGRWSCRRRLPASTRAPSSWSGGGRQARRDADPGPQLCLSHRPETVDQPRSPVPSADDAKALGPPVGRRPPIAKAEPRQLPGRDRMGQFLPEWRRDAAVLPGTAPPLRSSPVTTGRSRVRASTTQVATCREGVSHFVREGESASRRRASRVDSAAMPVGVDRPPDRVITFPVTPVAPIAGASSHGDSAVLEQATAQRHV